MTTRQLIEERRLIKDEALHEFAADVGDCDPVVVRGGGTQSDVGGSPQSDAQEVQAPTGIVDFRPDEMTVCVRAGTTVAELHATLAEAGQRHRPARRVWSVWFGFVDGRGERSLSGARRLPDSETDISVTRCYNSGMWPPMVNS